MNYWKVRTPFSLWPFTTDLTTSNHTPPHSLTHSLTHPLTHSHTHSLTHTQTMDRYRREGPAAKTAESQSREDRATARRMLRGAD
jgi:hypothetical protein